MKRKTTSVIVFFLLTLCTQLLPLLYAVRAIYCLTLHQTFTTTARLVYNLESFFICHIFYGLLNPLRARRTGAMVSRYHPA